MQAAAFDFGCLFLLILFCGYGVSQGRFSSLLHSYELHHKEMATIFSIENSNVAVLQSLSMYRDEDEVLFPPFSKFVVDKTLPKCPQGPDRVYWRYMGSSIACSRLPRSLASGPRPEVSAALENPRLDGFGELFLSFVCPFPSFAATGHTKAMQKGINSLPRAL